MGSFDDLLANNAAYAATYDQHFDGIAKAGVAVITCMDSRLEPLEMIGLHVGDAKILRNPGGHVTDQALAACILGVYLLNVTRIMVIPHTKCLMASGTDEDIRRRVRLRWGIDIKDVTLGADPLQTIRLAEDVSRLREHPLIAGHAEVGGFMYDVDTGRLTQVY